MPNPNNYQVALSNFIHCCGAFIVYHFDTKYVPKDYDDYKRVVYPYGTDQDFKNYVSQQCETRKEYQDRIKRQVKAFMDAKRGLKSYLIAVTNELEKNQGAEEVLKDLGWEVCIPETRNPTGSKITMWVYHLLPREKTNVKSALAKKA